MISINVYDKIGANEEEKELTTEHFEENRRINNFDETLQTYIMQNEVAPTGYQNFRVITDEVYNQTVRVRGQVVDQVIKQELHQAYIKVRDDSGAGRGRLITLCKKDDSFKVKEIFERSFNYNYEKHRFNIIDIIAAAADVRGARFDVQIETVNGISMKGTRVHNTQYYAQMLASGELTGVMLNYDMPDKTVTFRISVDGSILLYSHLDDYEILELIDDLLSI
ncbi:hypothetical protein IGW_01246 [Bacillus cereus ISP3191]|uniref:hypothetical protein n=1 Tax=Bacillus cereus TaxID=1396 RepID=UPI0002797211|nr:hypothetical protein [Bacillus cereus]EJQ96059.1 hypothetical protein IGW_01246 [Bacillus cereus ISP3191]MDR4324009.1 hypothetical protein [Bacillus paranthracis]